MDWIAFVLSTGGIILNARKNIWCWPVWILSTLAWGAYAVSTEQWPLLALQVVFGVLNCYGWYCWRKA